MSEYANYDDYNDPEEENEYDALKGKKLTGGKIVKKTLLFCLRTLAIFVFAILLWRVFSGGDPKTMQKFLWNESAIQAYNENSSEFLAYYYKHKDNLTSNGRFSASYVYFVPSMGQFQITVRYNDSTIKYLMEEYGLTEEPGGEPFVFTLTDNNGNTYTEYKYTSDTKNMYNYRRVIFDGVDMSSLIVENASPDASDAEKEIIEDKKEKAVLTLNVYYVDDVLLSEPYGTLSVYDYDYYHEPLNLDEYMFKDNTPTAGLTGRQEYTVLEEPEDTTEN